MVGKVQLHRPEVGPRRCHLGASGADVALVAVEEGHRHGHLEQPLVGRRIVDLALGAAHQVDVGDRLDDRPFQGPLGPGDVGLGDTRPGVAADDRRLQRLQVEVRQAAEEVGLDAADVGPWEADCRRELPPPRLDEHRRVEQPDLGPVAFDAPEEHVGLGALPGLGQLPADLVGPLGDVEQELVDLDPPLRDQECVVALPHSPQHVEAGAEQFVFGPLHLAERRLLGEPQLASGDDVLGHLAKKLGGRAVAAVGRPRSRCRRLRGARIGQRVGVELGLHGLAAGGLDHGPRGAEFRVVFLRQGHEFIERAGRGSVPAVIPGVDQPVHCIGGRCVARNRGQRLARLRDSQRRRILATAKVSPRGKAAAHYDGHRHHRR